MSWAKDQKQDLPDNALQEIETKSVKWLATPNSLRMVRYITPSPREELDIVSESRIASPLCEKEQQLSQSEEMRRLKRNEEEKLTGKMNEIDELRQVNETARQEMAALQMKFDANIDELVKKHRAQLQSEQEKADKVLKAKMKENENYTGARVVEAVDVYTKRYEDMMNSMGDKWDREKDLLTTTIDKLEDEKIATADKIEVLEEEIEGFSQYQVVLQRQNDRLIFQNRDLKSQNEEMLKKISEGLDDSKATSKLEKMRSQLRLALNEKRALEATVKNLSAQLETDRATVKNLDAQLTAEKMQGCFWRSSYEEATKLFPKLKGRPEKGRENEVPLSNHHP
ncbi:uncharacterized protein [Oscarella lobularis]|uniref:uncharacterized protein isoform X2 n=1 Tax=Oscarella lobularis TaxID=121494 RepID=UPI0033135B52